MRNNKAVKIGAALMCAALCAGAFVACDNNAPDTTEPEHFAAVAADCTHAGNIEYWTKGDKFYADAECTVELDESQTILSKLGHDYANGDYAKDYTGHWKVCAREGCDATDSKTDHAYSDGVCVCGHEEGQQPIDPTPTEYTITVSADIEHGTVTASAESAEAGATVTLTVTADENYVLKTLKYNDTEITASEDTYSFEMPAENVTIMAEFELDEIEQPPVDPTPTVQHVAAKSATCTENGNIEYWIKDGVNYSDAECTTEVTGDIVIEKLGHDFESGEYGHDGAEHWKVCARNDCDEQSEHTAHDHVVSHVKQATLGATGLKSFDDCGVCGAAVDDEVLPMATTVTAAGDYHGNDGTVTSNWQYGYVNYTWDGGENFTFNKFDTFNGDAWTGNDNEIKQGWINSGNWATLAYTVEVGMQVDVKTWFKCGPDNSAFVVRIGIKDKDGNTQGIPTFVCNAHENTGSNAFTLEAGDTIYIMFAREGEGFPQADYTVEISRTDVQ